MKRSGAVRKTEQREQAGAHERGHLAGNPFCAAHPDLARTQGARSQRREMDAESITLSPAQELQRREHANPRTLMRATKRGK